MAALHDKIPVTVIVTTLNEENNIARCLHSLARFDEVIVVDSGSEDDTREIARSLDAYVFSFVWNGQYPKKRQWCLDNLPLKHNRVFFVDADEEVTTAVANEIADLSWDADGYFVRGLYVVNGKTLRFGMPNKKLCLFDRRKMIFPIVDDLDVSGMGEIEGHYQPVFKDGFSGILKTLKSSLLHHALDDPERYSSRHNDYALWRKGMTNREAYPQDPIASRNRIKKLFQMLPFQRTFFFLYYYIVRLGVLEYSHHREIFRQKCRYYGI